MAHQCGMCRSTALPPAWLSCSAACLLSGVVRPGPRASVHTPHATMQLSAQPNFEAEPAGVCASIDKLLSSAYDSGHDVRECQCWLRVIPDHV